MKSVKPLIGLILILSCSYASAQQSNLAFNVSSINAFSANNKTVLSDPYGICQDFQRGVKVTNAPGQRMMRVGKTLTIAGGVLLVGGVVMMASADEVYYRTYTDFDGNQVTEGDLQGALGLIMAASGTGMIVPGIILWSKGKKRYEAHKTAEANLSLGINKYGAGLRYRF